MAFDFTPESAALNFGPRHHARFRSRKFLLWPAWAYRVVAPRVRQRKLNVLQRAILGLCRAGTCRVEPISEHLCEDPRLVALILSELGQLGYLDPHGVPTARGMGALEDDSSESHEMVAGYVFQDPWKGDLWPRFVESLDYCQLEFGESDFPSLLLGPVGKPKRHPVFTVLPRVPESPATPSPAAIVESLAQHRRALRFQDADEGNEEALGSFTASGVQIGRVSGLEERPQAVFLLTSLYVPDSEAGGTDWYACDPFGLGQSPRLRRRVEAVMDLDPGLFRIVNDLVGQTIHAGYEDQRTWLETIRLQAGLEIDRRLSVSFRTHDAFEQVLELESARQEMQLLGPDCEKRRIDEVLRAGVKVLEAVFVSIAVRCPLGDVWKRVYVPRVDRANGATRLTPQQDRRVCAATLEGAFRAIGFDDPIPESFLNVTPGQVRSVAEHGNAWRLRPLVTATGLLAQRDHPTHPLCRAAATFPGLLRVIDEIAAAGGGAGHAQGAHVTTAFADRHADKVYDVLVALLERDEETEPPSNPITGDSHVEEEQEQRVEPSPDGVPDAGPDASRRPC